MTATGPAQVVLRKLEKPVITGSVTVTWKMKTANTANTAAARNGFIVLSSDDNTKAALCAGAWMGANKMTLFENTALWGDGLSKFYPANDELDCRLSVNLDLRTATLTVNGQTLKQAFSETVTGLNYIGFGVQRADTLFTKPVLTMDSSAATTTEKEPK